MADLVAPASKGGSLERLTAANVAVVALMLALWTLHASFIWKYATDFPVADETYLLLAPTNPGLPAWVLLRQGMHSIVPTKLVYALFMTFGELNFATVIKLNFVLFGATLVALLMALRVAFRSVPLWLLILATCFLLSSRAWENHGWAFQNSFHFMLLFASLTVYFAFRDERPTSTTIAGLCAVCATFSLGAGLPVSLAIGVTALTKHVANRRPQLVVITAAWIAVVLALYLLTPPGESAGGEKLTLPTELNFWRDLFGLVSGGLGIDYDNSETNRALADTAIVGIIATTVCAAPVLIHLSRATSWRSPNYAGLALSLGIGAALATIALARAAYWGMGAPEKTSRYTEFSMVLIPTTIAWYWAVIGSQRARNITAAISFAVLLLIFAFNRDYRYRGFHNNWNYGQIYSAFMGGREGGYECVGQYYVTGTMPKCVNDWLVCIVDCRPILDAARNRPFSFVRKSIAAARTAH